MPWHPAVSGSEDASTGIPWKMQDAPGLGQNLLDECSVLSGLKFELFSALFSGFFVPLTHFSSWVCPPGLTRALHSPLSLGGSGTFPAGRFFLPLLSSAASLTWGQKALDLGKLLALLGRSTREKLLGSQESRGCPTWHSTSRESAKAAAPTPGRGTRT